MQTFILGEYTIPAVEFNLLSTMNKTGCEYIKRKVHEEIRKYEQFLMYSQIVSVILVIRNHFNNIN